MFKVSQLVGHFRGLRCFRRVGTVLAFHDITLILSEVSEAH